MRIVQADGREGVQVLMAVDDPVRGRMAAGVARFSPQTRHPIEGTSVHEAHETFFVLKGRLLVSTAEGEQAVAEGDFVYIAPGEEHWVANEWEHPAEVVWVLVGSTEV
ncbi:MAG: cupin domain-containing protein [Armatimonadota bacterium]|nr:cupin domain-containing protein [Armatimonadota bacterium]MDR5698010.1 cupin domain-containing protein [Armatimonadota bacterium]